MTQREKILSIIRNEPNEDDAVNMILDLQDETMANFAEWLYNESDINNEGISWEEYVSQYKESLNDNKA